MFLHTIRSTYQLWWTLFFLVGGKKRISRNHPQDIITCTRLVPHKSLVNNCLEDDKYGILILLEWLIIKTVVRKEFVCLRLCLIGAQWQSDCVVLHRGEKEAGHDLRDVITLSLTSLLSCLGVSEVVHDVILRIGPLKHWNLRITFSICYRVFGLNRITWYFWPSIKLIANEVKIISDSVHHNIKLLLVLWATGVVNLSASIIRIAKLITSVMDELIQIRGFERYVVIILCSIVLAPLIFYLPSRIIKHYLILRKQKVSGHHLNTAIKTNRIIGRTTSSIVINQCLRFNKRFFHDITRNLDPILFKLILCQSGVWKWTVFVDYIQMCSICSER